LEYANKKIFELETYVQDLSAKKLQQEDYKKHFLSIREEVLTWQHQQQMNMDKLEKAKEAISVIGHQKEVIAKLNSNLEVAAEEANDVRAKLKESEERCNTLTKEMEHLQGTFESHKQLLLTQNRVSAEKIQAVEEKYLSIKQINAGLEVQFLQIILNVV
jgi:predicted  nucleic acid-binding Zn-ribbon protein